MTGFYDEVNLPLWSDNPADADLLGFTDISEPIAQAIRRERLNPIAVGIAGPWGSGKTTVLNLLAAELASDPRVLVIETSPWAYDPNLDVKVTLIGEVLDRLYAHLDAALGAADEVTKGVKALVEKVRWSKAFALAAKTAITLQVPDWDSIEGLFRLDDGTPAGAEKDPTMNSFKAEFTKQMTLVTDIDRVVVLVDDLDRCLPESVIATLEAIKLFLAVEKMAFVIAYDEAPVTEAIKVRYEKAEKPADLAKLYLEKIIQVPVAIPRLGEDDVATYLAVTMLEGLIDEVDLRRVVTTAATRRRAGERPLLEGHDVTIAGNAAHRVDLAIRLAPMLTPWLMGNPRRIKRFINDFWMRSAIAKSRNAGLDADPLAKMMILEQGHPAEFKELVAWSAEGTAADNLARMEDGDFRGRANWAAIRAWVAMTPRLGGVPLRPYLELAASLRAIEYTGPRLTPALLAILDRLTDPTSGVVRRAAREDAAGIAPEERALLAEALIGMIPKLPGRQGDLADAIPDLVSGDDGVGKVVVEQVGNLDHASVEPVLLIRMEHVAVPSIQAFIESVRNDPTYAEAVEGLGTK